MIEKYNIITQFGDDYHICDNSAEGIVINRLSYCPFAPQQECNCLRFPPLGYENPKINGYIEYSDGTRDYFLNNKLCDVQDFLDVLLESSSEQEQTEILWEINLLK